MPSLSEIWNYYRHDRPEYERLLERERGMVDIKALVSIDEFLEKIVLPLAEAPLAEEKNPFVRLFKKEGECVENTLFYWASLRRIESANIKWDMMSEDVQALMERRHGGDSFMSLSERMDALVSREGFITTGDKEIQKLTDIRDLPKVQPSIEDCAMKHSALEKRRYPALYLGLIVQAIDVVVGREDALLYVENQSLWTGYGREALDFWKAVNTLRDYSSFFPNKPKLRGDTRDDSSGRVKVEEWKPAFGY